MPRVTNSMVRLEVETAPDSGLQNLLPNSQGDAGAWGWRTPVTNTNLTAAPFVFTTTVSQAAYLTSFPVPVTAGQYVAARLDLTTITASHTVRVSIEFLTVTKAANGATTPTGGAAGGVIYTTPTTIPAGTAYAQLRIDLYNGTGTTIPAANASVTFARAMLATGATAAAFSTAGPRPNMVTNYTFATNTAGWSAGTNATIAHHTGLGQDGTTSLRVLPAYSGAFSDGATAKTTITGITAGQTYTMSGYAYADVLGFTLLIGIRWQDAAGTQLGYTFGTTSATIPANGWARGSTTATAPTGTTKCELEFVLTWIAHPDAPADLAAVLIDAIQADPGPDLLPYYGASYAASGFDYKTTAYRDILGDSRSITISAAPLDASVMTAVVLDPALDPAISAALRPGRAIRASAWTGTAWEPFYTGQIVKPVTTYTPLTRVTITAADACAVLAGITEPRGVATIAELPYLLEAAAVPWNVAGSGNQVATAAVVSMNDAATLLDQVAVTRDSDAAYAWCDRRGVLQVQKRASLGTTPTVTFSDAAGSAYSYSDLDVDFSPDSCINVVTVNRLVYNADTQETEEVPFGPYVDQASVDAWGPYPATFTLQGPAWTETTIPGYASAVLAANATPNVKIHGIRVPIKTAAHRAMAATIGLYDAVRVIRTGIANQVLRVATIAHTVTPDGWLLDLTFDPVALVAVPRMAVRAAASGERRSSNAPIAAAVATAAAGWVIEQQAWTRSADTIQGYVRVRRTGAAVNVPASGNITNNTFATLPAAYKPATPFVALSCAETGRTASGIITDTLTMQITALTTGAGDINSGEVLSFGVTYLGIPA